jgi:hypothetical protein
MAQLHTSLALSFSFSSKNGEFCNSLTVSLKLCAVSGLPSAVVAIFTAMLTVFLI